jgi:hypothetical protein
MRQDLAYWMMFATLIVIAAYPLVWRFGSLAALLLPAGASPRRRRALPPTRLARPSGAPSCQL